MPRPVLGRGRGALRGWGVGVGGVLRGWLCIIPRADPMPREHEKNYGFTQFALELNELTPELKRFLPSTDTRLRPDQR